MPPLLTFRASLLSSLYPHQAITRQFPVGKPITLVGESLEAVEVGEGGVRRKSDGARLEGLVQCVVMAPDSLFLPVLPLRVRGKLMYGLCSTCLEKGLDRLCTHDGSARWLRGTWTTIELAYALGCGYRLVKVHELYVYERMGPIFEKFYLKLARIKLESEGFPTGVETPEDKQHHVDDLNEKMPGLGLSVDRVVKNEARRSFAKLVRCPERLALQGSSSLHLCLRSATPVWESFRRTTARSRLASSGAGRSWARPRRTRASGSSASIRSPKIWPRSLWRPSTSTSGESPCLLRSCG